MDVNTRAVRASRQVCPRVHIASAHVDAPPRSFARGHEARYRVIDMPSSSRTHGFNGYAVKFSPYFPQRIAIASAQNFGIIGNGAQIIADVDPTTGSLVEIARFPTRDGLYDCAWSEGHESVLVSACGDGSVKAWDVGGGPSANPLRSFHEHTHEVYGVSWNVAGGRDSFLSASWDDKIKLWTLDRPESIRTFAEHAYCVYAAEWSPHHADIFASASGDCLLKIWDVRQPHATLSVPVHDYEALCCDWNKWNDSVIATGSVDKTVKLWDIRNPSRELRTLVGHEYAVRRVKCSPHSESIVYTCSYDMSVAMWDTKAPGEPLLNRWTHHTEFAVGLDTSCLIDGLIASCGWDEMVHAWNTIDGSPPPAPGIRPPVGAPMAPPSSMGAQPHVPVR
ncbi:G-protein beta WD-40 repeat [Ostreococcus tauri]|uniref:Peroxin-7 n=1 Tax=Ostreococcus tauri TaxID=70448 RepID=A0A090M5G9_OSTTA|nr:G-protein beta WD-40 repeat [Ostreococcus tauri]CEF99490.1 G-protein beta WD-40 repeat [Ostreococcus tauri]|eukprot:XP_003081781.2 G-protein beta WD-40 repeat [Ostreococcus tauri]